jgi:hypothetical protein
MSPGQERKLQFGDCNVATYMFVAVTCIVANTSLVTCVDTNTSCGSVSIHEGRRVRWQWYTDAEAAY